MTKLDIQTGHQHVTIWTNMTWKLSQEFPNANIALKGMSDYKV